MTRSFQAFPHPAVLAGLLGLALVAGMPAQAATATTTTSTTDNSIAKFDGGIGVTVAARDGDLLVPNDVLGVPPGGRPWVIAGLTVGAGTSTIAAAGKGLLLAGGPGVGTTANQEVHAVLFCDGIPYESASVPLAANGDFSIKSGYVGANGNPPSACLNARLLIVNANGLWFAAGIPKP